MERVIDSVSVNDAIVAQLVCANHENASRSLKKWSNSLHDDELISKVSINRSQKQFITVCWIAPLEITQFITN